MVKAILGYDIMPGMTVEAYEKWLREVHIPDLARVPGLKKIVFNTVKGVVRGDSRFYRIAELHYESMEVFERDSSGFLMGTISFHDVQMLYLPSKSRGQDGEIVQHRTR